MISEVPWLTQTLLVAVARTIVRTWIRLYGAGGVLAPRSYEATGTGAGVAVDQIRACGSVLTRITSTFIDVRLTERTLTSETSL